MVCAPKFLVEQGYTVPYFSRYLHDFQHQDVYLVHGFKKHTEAVDIKPFISLLEVTTGEAGQPCLQMILKTHLNVMIKPGEVLHLVFDIPYEKILDFTILRVSMETENL